MSTARALTLYRPGELPDVPAEVPRMLVEGALLLNHGLLIAELLGLDTREAQEAVDIVGRASTEELSAYHEDDAEILARLFKLVVDRLEEAIASSGVPTGPLGDRLVASPLMMRDSEGRLLFKSHRLPVSELRRRLPDLNRMLSFAAESNWWIRVE